MKWRLTIGVCLFSLTASAQLGGTGTYRFLQVSANARIVALGGNAISTPDPDLNLVSQNPSLLSAKNHNQLGFNTINYFADIQAGEFNYGRHLDSQNLSLAAGVQYLNYGSFTRTAPDGQVLGNFSAGEYNYHVSASRQYGSIRYGATLKFIYSNLETYSSYGMATDLAACWISNDRLITATAVVSNLGTQFKTYTTGNREPLPLNVQLGFSKKFEHNPFRIGIIAYNLQNPGALIYQIPSRQYISLETGEPMEDDLNFLDKAMSHLIFNTEMILGKTLNLRFAYNPMRQREMSLSNVRGFNGFSWGFGIRINRFQLAYGNGGYMPGQNTNAFSIITCIDDFRKAKKPQP